MAQVGDVQLRTQDTELVTHEVVGRTPWQLFWRRFRKDRWAVAGGIVIIIIVALAFFGGPLAAAITHHSLDEKFIYQMTDEFGSPKGPVIGGEAGTFVFGADGLGRDVLVRLLYGARATLIVAISATIIEVVVGLSLGMIAGFYRGKVDTVISRSAEVVLTLPVTMLAIGLAAACGVTKEGCLGGAIKPGIPLVTLILAIFSWPYILRVIRGQVLTLREREFVEASRSLGASNGRIIWREILPNVFGYVLVYSALIIPINVLFEAGLSFLGVGLPPSVPSWGRMIDEGAETYRTAWWLMLFPGLFVLALTLAFNLLGEGLRDALDPRREVG